MGVAVQVDIINGVTFSFTATLQCRKVFSHDFGRNINPMLATTDGMLNDHASSSCA